MASETLEGLVARCTLLRSLHVPRRPVVLANAWDVASARAIESSGLLAVATSSGAVAATIGQPDHEGGSGVDMLAVAALIAGSVAVPVTVDAEAGYGWSAGELAGRLLEAGAAGANLEDTDHRAGTIRSISEQCAYLAGVRDAADRLGYPLVLNARIDVFVRDRDRDPSLVVDDAISRANAYLGAGADCVYPIFLSEPAIRARFIESVAGNVNLLTWPGGPTVPELAAAGAARISYGTTLHRVAMAALQAQLETIVREVP